MRDAMIELFRAGVRRADPAAAVRSALDAGEGARPDAIVALGKAAVAMARPAMDRWPGCPTLVVTTPENAIPLPGAHVLAGSHPVPDARSHAAGTALLGAVAPLGAGQRALALISGGGSALAVAPIAGVTLDQKAEVNRLLLGAGLDIRAMNVVRQALSRMKGGGLARAAAPARVDTLILSDVIGDDPAVVASGPTVPGARPSEARRILHAAGIWGRLPGAVRDTLDRDDEAAAVEVAPMGDVTLVGSNRLSVEAMAAAAPKARIDPVPLEGDVADAAAHVARAARGAPGLTLWGGETTVRLEGAGRGGRNQELALRVAALLSGAGTDPASGLARPWAFLSGGTDGRDGPTDAAGALVDHGTLDRIAAAGLDAHAALARNDSYPALDAAGDLLRTGSTGTNVADLQILWVGRGPV